MRATDDLHICGSCRRPFVIPDAIVSAPHGVEGVVAELPLHNPKRWPDALRTVVVDKLPQAVVREHARAEYDWRSVSARFIDILEGVR